MPVLPGGITEVELGHVPQFSGNVWYVSKDGNDSNSGISPLCAFLTINHAISVASAGDAITVKAGTYDETGIDLNKNSIELWFENGTILDPVSGTALTVSGDYCLIKGRHQITPAAGEIGVLISGDDCFLSSGKILNGAIGVRITGSGVVLNDYAVGYPTSIAYDIQGDQARLYLCKTTGNAATIGYKISNGADTGVLESCTSSGHATAGYYIDTGSENWTLLNCSSGAGDGRWVDKDNANVWSNFTFDDKVYSLTTFAGAATTYNIFKLTGSVRLIGLTGHVTTPIANTASDLHIELYSTGGTVDITDAPGPNIQALVAGATLVRNEDSTGQLDVGNPDGVPATVENINFRDPETAIDIIEDNGADTYIRLVLSVALASGAIHWHAKWIPISNDGFLEAA